MQASFPALYAQPSAVCSTWDEACYMLFRSHRIPRRSTIKLGAHNIFFFNTKLLMRSYCKTNQWGGISGRIILRKAFFPWKIWKKCLLGFTAVVLPHSVWPSKMDSEVSDVFFSCLAPFPTKRVFFFPFRSPTITNSVNDTSTYLIVRYIFRVHGYCTFPVTLR